MTYATNLKKISKLKLFYHFIILGATYENFGLVQSMNSTGGRCNDNARYESMWARMKEELFYSRNRKSEDYTIEELKSIIGRYFMNYWNNRRICSANSGLLPAIKRRQYYETQKLAA